MTSYTIRDDAQRDRFLRFLGETEGILRQDPDRLGLRVLAFLRTLEPAALAALRELATAGDCTRVLAHINAITPRGESAETGDPR
jgi:hypothetical protein